MKNNIKKVKITILDQKTLNRLNSTPTFNRLSRLKLKVGDNFENVNHSQYSDMFRLYKLINVSIEEII
jgi:hypothetical protein